MLSSIRPKGAVPGGRVTLIGSRLPVPADGPPQVTIGGQSARVVAASSRAIGVLVPEVPGGPLPVRVGELPSDTLMLDVARVLTTGVHQVDSPLCDANGFVYLTNSGGRDTKAPVSMYRVGSDGVREPIAVEIANPTSMARGPDGSLYVSSRFEGQVFRLTADLRAELFATDLGVATGLACAPDGTLYVGDRSGTILRVSAGQSGESARHVEPYATIPSSVAAFHLALGPDGTHYVTAPTMASHDVLYRVTPAREVQIVCGGFGRPQGLAFDAAGVLFVADALAGGAGLYRVDVRESAPAPELVIAAPHLVGVAFDPQGGMVLASHDTIWRI
ncbi:MAG TPA: IPT/TIG domain-containing protein [Vicinamibacterales bacterium]|nr:IPT/TIG domain-containing protein [Vicinamibacterales bacterium]